MATNPTTTTPTSPYTPRGEAVGPFGTQGQQPDQNREAQQRAPREGKVAKTIEQQTAQWPSDTFLWAAVGAMTGSLVLRSANQKQASLWLGQWVSPLLLFGVYNKLVKLGGSDRYSRP